MYYSSSQKEIVAKDPDSYSDFGAPYNSFPLVSDPVDVCLPGSYLNPEKSSDLDYNNCPIYMSQRCSSTWDDKCNLYANSLDDPVLLKNFIRAVASKKFCHLNSDSTCKELCQPFNPIAQDSPQVCSNVGKDVLKNSNDNIDIGWYLPANMSPDYMSTSCNQTCDVVTSSSIDPSDVVVNACLKYGYCNDILTNMCQLSGNTPISHPGLKQYCDSVSVKESVKEGFSSHKLNAESERPGDHPFNVSKHPGNGNFVIHFLIFVLLCVLAWMGYKMYKKKSRSR